ncbi:MAG: DUF4922 domain-containing protein [Planctomycetota bacterium]|jgi:hypothetical protein
MNNDRILTLAGGLSQQVEELWRRQVAEWPLLGEGLCSLTQARRRSFKVGSWPVVAQCNPARLASASARIDAESLARRPCILCEGNLPAAQQAILYNGDWLILCNPAPLFEPHFTIATLAHEPQLVDLGMDTMLEMARDFNGSYTVFYNGPRSGASVPEHLHLQAGPSGVMPFEAALIEQLAGGDGDKSSWIDWIRSGAVRIGVTGCDRVPAVILRSDSRGAMRAGVEEVIAAVGEVQPAEVEPMLNFYVLYRDGSWIGWLFPRSAHRPAFYGMGADDYMISPGSVDLGGIMIVPREADFDRLDVSTIQQIYDQVLWDPEALESLVGKLAG